jgi:hypothetical protein
MLDTAQAAIAMLGVFANSHQHGVYLVELFENNRSRVNKLKRNVCIMKSLGI